MLAAPMQFPSLRNLTGWMALMALAACEPRASAGGATGLDGRDVAPAGPVATASAAPAMSASGQAVVERPVPEVKLAVGGKLAASGSAGMVASEDVEATNVGVSVLAAGGNAVDAAIAVAYALAVTHHGAGSLGGGGFMVVHLADGTTHAIDYREKAPAKATVKLNDKQLAAGAHGYLSAPVPGVVAGLELAREKFGSKPRAELIAPAIRLAREGFPYGARQAEVLGWYWKRITDPTFKAVLGRGGGPIGAGQTLKQTRLAETLEAIRDRGTEGFYQGGVAAKIADAMQKHGGLVTVDDLSAYQAKLREPLSFVYRGFEIFTMPPPSMGGIALLSIMHNLAAMRAHEAEVGSAASYHYFVEAAKRAYADRRSIGADPDMVDMTVVGPRRDKLLDPRYYAERVPQVVASAATPSKAIVPLAKLTPAPKESPETTHFSVVDRHGNAVSCTTTLSAAFGSWTMIPGVGVIFSNAMGAFSLEGVNVLAPHKRMASSMSPAIITASGKAVAVIGSPGGDTIPSTVAQLAYHLIDHGMTIDEAIETGRVHHQYQPDVVRGEKTRPPPAKIIGELTKLGHRVELSPWPLGDANGIVIDADTGTAYGHADTRKGGLASGPKQ